MRRTVAELFGFAAVFAVLGFFIAAPAFSGDTVWTWGRNVYGQLGNGTTYDIYTSLQVNGISGVVSATAGNNHVLALKSDGTVWAWGCNSWGQLGNYSTTSSSTPVQVKGYQGYGNLSSVVAVSGGFNHSVALKSDGTVWAWGENTAGQLGDGTNDASSTPVQVKDSSGENYLTGVTAIAAGGYFTLALDSGGTVWAWGSSSPWGQCGPNAQGNLPAEVTGLDCIVAVAAGGYHSLALASDGTVWAWGKNIQGQLAIDPETYSFKTTPTQVSGLSGVTTIQAGEDHSLAIKSDGAAWAWGAGGRGRLGNGTTSNSYTPVQVSGLSGAKAIVGGQCQSIALKSDGTVWAWGRNDYGQCGDGTTTDRHTPVQVKGRLSNIEGIATGWGHGVAW